MDLKQGVIYQLPNGRELVAHRTSGNRFVLNNLNGSEPCQYELNSDGRLMLSGRLTAWGLEELLDTGRMISKEAAAVLIETLAVGADTNEQSV